MGQQGKESKAIKERDNRAERMRTRNMASLLQKDNVQKRMLQERNARSGQA